MDDFIAAGGTLTESEGRKCLCNGLAAAVGLAQLRRDGSDELPLVTSGDSLLALTQVAQGRSSYSVQDVLDFLLAEPAAT